MCVNGGLGKVPSRSFMTMVKFLRVASLVYGGTRRRDRGEKDERWGVWGCLPNLSKWQLGGARKGLVVVLNLQDSNESTNCLSTNDWVFDFASMSMKVRVLCDVVGMRPHPAAALVIFLLRARRTNCTPQFLAGIWGR